MFGKGTALLRFLQEATKLRRKRIPGYGARDRVLWFANVPKDRSECRSAFLTDNPEEFNDIWLEIRKTRMPARPPVPESVVDWIRPQDLDRSDEEPELLPEITVLVEREVVDPDAPSAEQGTNHEKAPESRRLVDHPEVEDAWLDYLVNQWEPWSQEIRRWQEVHAVYESVDFMRRRLEQAEERYELLLGVGLVQWRDSTGKTIKRHLLTAPAEIELDAARGILTVVPAASFERFRIELDMLELQDQPRLDNQRLEEKLQDLDVRGWDTTKVGEILHEIANRANTDAQVEEQIFEPAKHADGTFHVVYAPALVLRERRPTAFEEVVKRLLVAVDGESPEETTEPWNHFLAEGDPACSISQPSAGEQSQEDRSGCIPGGILFPLPTNDEQRQIVSRLGARPFVVVKGPPGTGKSLTIANLICHLLAKGERVLVTAQVAKGLRVLRGLLPEDVQALCVTALGSSREDQRFLEEGVRGILRRQSEWGGSELAQKKIRKLEGVLQNLKDQLAVTNRKLRECRESETHSHSLPGGYEGTAARIAKHLEHERDAFGWFPQTLHDQPAFPLGPKEVRLLTEMHDYLSEERIEELRSDTGDLTLPDPESFTQMIAELEEAEDAAGRAKGRAIPDKLEFFAGVSSQALETTRATLRAIEEISERATRVFGDLASEILKDLLAGRSDRWKRLAQEAASLMEDINIQRERLGTARILLPEGLGHERLRVDAEQRLEHFDQGGRRGISVIAPRVVRKTRHIEERCEVDGRPPRDLELLGKVVAFLRLEALVNCFATLWPSSLGSLGKDPRRVAKSAAELTSELKTLLEFFEKLGADWFPSVSVADRLELAARDKRSEWHWALEAEAAFRRVRVAAGRLDEIMRDVRTYCNTRKAHGYLRQMAEAIEKRDVAGWRAASEERGRIEAMKDRFSTYEALLERLHQVSPSLVETLRNSQGDSTWEPRIRQLKAAWMWASACGWIREVSDPNVYRDLMRSSHRLRDQIEKTTEKLAALHAWHVFFERLDEATVQDLTAWARAMDRIGKGTGKYAYRHRKTARRYLIACIPKIPAWVMPLHKLWDSVDAKPGLFDTVIVDEASQAGIDSLVLFLLAKRVVIVGDEKQNSPEAVGVREDDVARLAREHLSGFRFCDEFRPDTSLFDHAERAFGNLLSLREHFRCVPEIIRFSNDLCYRDAPLIVLRQAPPDRLDPLKATFVRQGACEGEGQRIFNHAEAEAVVGAIQSCLDDEAYDGKTMGVIALQGHAQAERIATMLVKEVGPKVIEERRLRCGVPAAFQGDERDVVFLSMVIAPNVRYRALSRLPDQRRFNVAMSRARDQVWLFHSIGQEDLSLECLRHRLLRFFKNPRHEVLDRLTDERERLERLVRASIRHLREQPEPYESWFEVDVALELLRRNYAIRPQYEVASKRIDLVVEGVDTRLAVECDGEAWHGPEDYEHDMARQRQLERAGWTFEHVRESEFYTDRRNTVNRIIAACNELGIEPVGYRKEQVALHDERQAVEEDTIRQSISEEPDLPVFSEASDADGELADAGSGPFTGYSEESAHPDPREASGANIRSALRQIIERDGPLMRVSVYRLYIEGCSQLQRAGRVVRQTLNRALGVMLRSGEIVQEDELGERSLERMVVRLARTPKVRERPAGRRDLLEIPPSEVSVILQRLAPIPRLVSDEEQLFRRLLDHYGYTRLTRLRRKYVKTIWQSHLRNSNESAPARNLRGE